MQSEEFGLGAAEVFMVFGMAFLFIIPIILFYGFCIGKIFAKAGKPLWAGFIPLYNNFVLLEIVGRPPVWFLFMFIPFLNIYVTIVTYIDLAKSFGKDTGFGVLLWLLGFIFLPVLAFGDAQYIGPSAAGKTGLEM